MKQCKTCKMHKNEKQYYKRKDRNNIPRLECKTCTSKAIKLKERTKDGLITNIFITERRSSKKRGFIPPEYTKEELKEWLTGQELFHKLFDEWVKSGYLKNKRPSVDRKDDYIGYKMDNIQLMTWQENSEKGNKDRFNGLNNKHSKAVEQFTKDNEFIKRFYSISKASRETGVNLSKISECCKGKYKTAGGFIWGYSDAKH